MVGEKLAVSSITSSNSKEGGGCSYLWQGAAGRLPPVTCHKHPRTQRQLSYMADMCCGVPVAFAGCQTGALNVHHQRERGRFSHAVAEERCGTTELPGGSDAPMNPRCCSCEAGAAARKPALSRT